MARFIFYFSKLFFRFWPEKNFAIFPRLGSIFFICLVYPYLLFRPKFEENFSNFLQIWVEKVNFSPSEVKNRAWRHHVNAIVNAYRAVNFFGPFCFFTFFRAVCVSYAVIIQPPRARQRSLDGGYPAVKSGARPRAGDTRSQSIVTQPSATPTPSARGAAAIHVGRSPTSAQRASAELSYTAAGPESASRASREKNFKIYFAKAK